MATILNILVPIDFSEESRSAAAFACTIAKQQKASVHLAHVVDRLEPISVSPSVGQAMLEDEMACSRDRLAGIAKRIFGTEVTATTEVLVGRPAHALADYAKTSKADLICMGAHGVGGGGRFFGSVTLKTAASADIPVLVVRKKMKPPTTPGFKHPLIGVDYTAGSAELVELASSLARGGATKTLLHVVEMTPDFSKSTLESVLEHDLAALEKFTADLDVAVVPVATRSRVGNAAAELLEHAGDAGVDLVVVGVHGPGEASGRLGTVADRLARRADLPILLVPTHSGRSHSPPAI